MAHLRYPTSTVYADYSRVALGLAVCFGPLLLLDVAGPLATALAGFGLLFAWFGARTVLRHLSWIELSADAIALRGPIERRVLWRQLELMKLAYYAPRRAQRNGWLQLTLGGASGRPIRLDSTLAGFDQVLHEATSAARAKDLPLDPTTEANLVALGLDGSA